MKKIPVWLFDWIADTVDGDLDELLRLVGEWEEVLPAPGFDLARYRQLRARAVAPVPFDETQHTGFWKRVDP